MKNKFEKFPKFESNKPETKNPEKEMTPEREEEIDKLIEEMPEEDREGMSAQEIIEWLAGFANIVGPTFIEEVADKINISAGKIKISYEEMYQYAKKKAKDAKKEIELTEQKHRKNKKT